MAALCGGATACLGRADDTAPGAHATDTAATTAPDARDRAPDTSWVVVVRPTIVAFHPLATNEQLAADEGLATALDDLAYHLGTAMDSLIARQFIVRYVPGDTVKLFAAAARPFVFVRNRDSSDVGYVFADSAGRRAIVYGVRTHSEIVDYATAFLRSGVLPPTR